MKQALLALGGLVLVILLYFFAKTIPEKGEPEPGQARSFSFEEYERLQVPLLSADSASIHDSIKLVYEDLGAEDSLLLTETLVTLAEFWLDAGNIPLSAYYQYRKAERTDLPEDWELAGDGFLTSLSGTQDTLIKNNLITFALASYEAVLSVNQNDLDCRYKRAKVHIEGETDLMKGVLEMRNIAEEFPDYVPAQLELGRLSIVSGQYDKAVERLNKVLSLEPANTEAIYFQAIAHEGIGDYEEAIRLFEICKVLVGNPEFSREVDGYIEELRKK